MLRLLRNATVFAPEPRGVCDVLVAGERVAWLGPRLDALPAALAVEVTDLEGRTVIPGLVDGHAHLTGGGGEAGPHTRVPAPPLSRYTLAGVTTAVGVLGTDDVTRTTAELVVTARGLIAEGLSAWCHTGGYHLPPATLTGSVRGDIVHIDRIIGVGEVAVSDHRSSQPTLDELLRVAADAHVGGLMTGKAGILHLHLGDGARGLSLVREALDRSELPPRVFNPTHVNRRRPLFEEALELARRGCVVDITAFDVAEDEDAWSAADALARYLVSGAPAAHVTVSSDGGGCLPTFDADGRVTHMGVGDAGSLLATVRTLIARGLPLEAVLPAFTSNAADLLRLPGKGRLTVGADADLVVLDDTLHVTEVMARGAWQVRRGAAVRRGTFE
ncbi:MAG: beta-aspartyl-peptidase [Gemmatimonas sp.]|jgi:beta-aspartyl-dipeptidase (metallo-type)|uniref:beta-aspartyl-peptidase n=1 Tax=Gemmatimonas sp. TaxID=1962908 RepID=UPI00391F73E7|nr:beta-aspartyl-peptidase [Gemmatimonadota bacterium]